MGTKKKQAELCEADKEQQFATLKRQVAAYKGVITSKENEIVELKDKIFGLEANNEKLREVLNELNYKIKQKDDTISNLLNKVDTIRIEADSYARKCEYFNSLPWYKKITHEIEIQ